MRAYKAGVGIKDIDHEVATTYKSHRRVFDSVLNRTGIDVRKFDSILHATTSPGRDEKGNILDYANVNIVRNV